MVDGIKLCGSLIEDQTEQAIVRPDEIVTVYGAGQQAAFGLIEVINADQVNTSLGKVWPGFAEEDLLVDFKQLHKAALITYAF